MSQGCGINSLKTLSSTTILLNGVFHTTLLLVPHLFQNLGTGQVWDHWGNIGTEVPVITGL